MRVLGVDPGLTRCGLGVVDGAPGAAGPGRSRAWSGPTPTPTSPSDWSPSSSALDAGLDRWRPDAVAVERVFSQHNVRTVMGTAQASGVAIAGRRAARPAGRAAHAQRGQGRRHRQRSGRQGPGHGDGDPAAAALRAAQAGRRRRRPGAGDLPPVARHARRAGMPAAVAAAAPMIASVRGAVTSLAPDGAVVEVGGVGLAGAVHARHAGRPARRRHRGAGHLAGRPRGLPDAVRLRRRRRARRCSSCCRPPAASVRGWPRRCSRCTRRTPAPGRGHRGPAGAVPGPRHRAQGRAADRAGAARPARTGRRRGARSSVRAPVPQPAGGSRRSTPRCSGSAGRPARPTRPCSRSRRRPRGDGQRRRARTCRVAAASARLQTLSRG